jgi:MFS family permease
MQASMVIFLIGSALSTGAANMPMLLVGRGIAGIGAAGLLSVSDMLTFAIIRSLTLSIRLCELF